MNENKIDKKIKTYGLVLGIVLFVLLIAGFTYAALNWRSSNIVISGNTECLDIESTKGSDITGEELLLLDESSIINGNKITIKEGMVVTNVTAKIKSGCTIAGYMTLNLNVTSLNSAFTSSGNSTGALKYVVATYNPSSYPSVNISSLKGKSFDIDENAGVITTGSITSTGTIKIKEKQLSTSETISYLIIFYIDGNLANNDAAGTGNNFTTSITAEVTQGALPGVVTENVKAVDFITNLYTSATKTPKTVNSIEYNLAPSVSLMNDRLGSVSTLIDSGNIRYYGSSPNNYIYFNCDDYTNQTSSTCETWRIIGVFEGKVKIMRGSQIGSLAWDQDKNIDSSKTTYDNDWSTSSLQVLLNTSYLNRTANVTYYSGSRGTTTTIVSTSTIGIKDSTRDMISESMWYLRGWNSSSVYSDQIYNYERTTGSVYNETTRDKSWTGKIALAYPSDYGYAADLSQCTIQLSSYNDSTCTSNNWMKTIITNNGGNPGWLLTSHSGYSYYAWLVYSSGNVRDYNYTGTYDAYGAAPVLYLNSNISIKEDTNGTTSNPFKLIP